MFVPTNWRNDCGDKFDWDEEGDIVDDSEQSAAKTAHVSWQQLSWERCMLRILVFNELENINSHYYSLSNMCKYSFPTLEHEHNGPITKAKS